MNFLRGPRLVAFAGVAGLAACGGGGVPEAGGGTGEDRIVTAITTTPDGRVLAGSERIVPTDFVGRTFPLSFYFGDDGPPRQQTVTGIARLEVVDTDTLVVTRDGERSSFVRSGANEFRDGSGRVLQIADLGAMRLVGITDGTSGLLGTFGLETPVAARPVTAFFSGRSVSSLLIDLDGLGSVVGMTATDVVRLHATFSGSSGTIWGTLFDGSTDVDLDNSGTDDRLFVQLGMNGNVTEGGFTGTISGSADAVLDHSGSALENLSPLLSNSSVNGKFFGTAAQVASGTYSADVVMGSDNLAPLSGRAVGLFLVTQ
jgi:hypothetical protein